MADAASLADWGIHVLSFFNAPMILRPIHLLLALLWMHVTHQWDPTSDHPCTIEQFSAEQLVERFGSRGVPPLYPEPLVLRLKDRNNAFRELVAEGSIRNNFPDDFVVTLSSSNSLSEHRRKASLSDYINETVSLRETYPDQLSNESWYLFGETYSDGA